MIWTFILGVMLGASVGVMITCLCVIAKRSDERAARMVNRSDKYAVKQSEDDLDTSIEDFGGWFVALFIVALIIMFVLLL